MLIVNLVFWGLLLLVCGFLLLAAVNRVRRTLQQWLPFGQPTQTRQPPTIAPISTRYAGHYFRSRTEARWALFFDQLGIEYEYELEGYVIAGLPYLPDFYLPEQRCWVEVKPARPEGVSKEEEEKAALLAEGRGELVLLVTGSPGKKEFLAFFLDRTLGVCRRDDLVWWECPDCLQIGLCTSTSTLCLHRACPKQGTLLALASRGAWSQADQRVPPSARLTAAYHTAWQARFEPRAAQVARQG